MPMFQFIFEYPNVRIGTRRVPIIYSKYMASPFGYNNVVLEARIQHEANRKEFVGEQPPKKRLGYLMGQSVPSTDSNTVEIPCGMC